MGPRSDLRSRDLRLCSSRLDPLSRAGLRATIIQNFFAEFKFEFRYDSTPAIGARKEDLRYLVGVGWSF